MRLLSAAALAVVIASIAGACATVTGDPCADAPGACGAADGSVVDGNVSDGGADVVVRPDGGPCGADKTPFETNCTPTEGTFVKPGATGGDGTIGKPLGSLTAALAKGGNIYVCAGTLSEKIALSSTQAAAKVYGGLDCATWRFADGAATKVVVEEVPAFQASDVAASVEISDVSFETTAGATSLPGATRIAALVSNAQALSFVRSGFKAAAGRAGADADVGVANARTPADGKGNNAVGVTKGAELICTCADGTTTTGGAGGAPATRGGDGSALPFVYADVAPFSGSGGNGGCSSGAAGQNGKAGDAGGAAPAAGTLAATGWTPSIGTSATPSNAGQGGGGGGGAAAAGGSGGCGGCGGTPGKGGFGGGGSIAFASIGSTVTFAKCSFSVGAGGVGGKGGKGLDGQAGGTGGSGGACPGGSGGNGAGGSGGGGGNGGISAGIVYIGARPSADAASTFSRPSVGAAGGKGGEAGAAAVTDGTHQGNPGLAGAAGKDGEVADVFEVK